MESVDLNSNSSRLTEDGVQADLQRQRHILLKLAENSLTVAESLRNNYFKNTAKFVTDLRRAIQDGADGRRQDIIMQVNKSGNPTWANFQGEVVSFIDGGVGQVEISSQVPILLRVGSYSVKTGEQQLAEREQFGYYPVILGDLEGGSKDRKDFIDVVRIIAELLGGLSVLKRTPNIRVLMFHGPLVYLVGSYAGHTPFTEKDIDLFLRQYAAEESLAEQLKTEFLKSAKLYVYPDMTQRANEWAQRRLFEPLAWMAFLYQKLISEAKTRNPVPLIVGVVERGELREFSEKVLLERVFTGLRKNDKEDYFNKLFGRQDLNSPKALLDRLGYNDSLLLAMLLQPGEWSESWSIEKYKSLHTGKIILPGESFDSSVSWSHLKPGTNWAFPKVQGCYLQVSETTEPVRVETFETLGTNQLEQVIPRIYLYSRLLPGYGFPVGLDIADKYAHIPQWLTSAYSKLIKHHLGVSLQRGEISDSEMRRILVQAIYMTHRDWLFRPKT